MANLPDINTANVGIIAFWNAEDHKTAGVADPTDCTGVFTSYSVYDNGLDGYITLGSGRHFNCRVKNDGWCVAWIDRTNTFGHPTLEASAFGESGYKGYYDILWNWFQYSANISSTLTTLSYIISLFEAALETSGDFTFATTDVGHYCYEFPDANVLTLLGHRLPSGSGNVTAYLQYTNGTIIYYNAIASTVYGMLSHAGKMYFAGNTIASTSCDPQCVRYGTASILDENWAPDPLTEYAVLGHAAALGATAHGVILILWS